MNRITITRTITRTIALAASMLGGATAHANVRPPGQCTQPALAACENATYLASTCGERYKGLCSSMLADQAELDDAGWGSRAAELPLPEDNPDYTAVNHPGATSSTIVSSMVAPYDYGSHYAHDLRGLYIGTVTRNNLTTLQPSVFAFDPRVAWQSDGSRINSCEEFVYKRYRTYSRFEDAIASAGTNYAASLWVALWGDDGLTGSQIFDDQGQPTATVAPQPRLKNPYFAGPSLFTNVPWGMTPHEFDYSVISRHPFAYWFEGDYWKGGWAEQQNAALQFETLYPMDLLERLDAKSSAFEEMLARRQKLMDSWINERVFIERNVCIRLAFPGNDCGSDATSIPQLAALLARYEPQFVALDNQIDAAWHEGEALGCLEPGINPCDWSPHRVLRDLDRQINEPRETSLKLCNGVLNNDFRATGSRLAQLKAVGWADAEIYPGDLNQSAQILEYVLERARDFVQAYVRNLPINPATGKPRLGDAASDNASIGNDSFGAGYDYDLGFQIEDLEAGVSYAEAHAWATFNASGTVFGINVPLVHGTVDVHSREDGDTTLIDHTLSFVVLGEELLPDGSGTDALTFHVATGNSTEREFFGESAIIPVGPIPVKISGWLTGVAGVNVTLDGGVERQHSPDARLDALKVDLRGKLDPFAELVAHASASIDLVLIEAGIKGRLTLVRLDLPFTMGVGVSMIANEDGSRIDSVLEGSAQLDLVLHTLDGGLTVFVDTVFHNFEKDILSWEGYQSTWPLFNVAFQPINLGDIRAVLTGEI